MLYAAILTASHPQSPTEPPGGGNRPNDGGGSGGGSGSGNRNVGGGGSNDGPPGIGYPRGLNFDGEEAVLVINGRTYTIPAAPVWDTKPVNGHDIIYSAKIVSGPPGYSCFFWNIDRASGSGTFTSFPPSSSSSSSSATLRNTFVSKTFYANGPSLTVDDPFPGANRLTCFRLPQPERPEANIVVWLDQSIPPRQGMAFLQLHNHNRYGPISAVPFKSPVRLERTAIVHGPGSIAGSASRSSRSSTSTTSSSVDEGLEGESRDETREEAEEQGEGEGEGEASSSSPTTPPGSTCRAYYGPRGIAVQQYVEFDEQQPWLRRIERVLGLICFGGDAVELGIPQPFKEL